MQGGQEDALESGNPKVFLNLQYKAGPHTPKAEITANMTKQHLKQAPDLLDISLSLSLSPIKMTVCVCVCQLLCLEKRRVRSNDDLSNVGYND
jgi:hypothetical protein